MRLWPRKYIQPDYAAALTPRVADDCHVGDALAFGVFLFVGMLVLASISTGWLEMPRTNKASPSNMALSEGPTAKPFARAKPAKLRRSRIVMAQRQSP